MSWVPEWTDIAGIPSDVANPMVPEAPLEEDNGVLRLRTDCPGDDPVLAWNGAEWACVDAIDLVTSIDGPGSGIDADTVAGLHADARMTGKLITDVGADGRYIKLGSSIPATHITGTLPDAQFSAFADLTAPRVRALDRDRSIGARPPPRGAAGPTPRDADRGGGFDVRGDPTVAVSRPARPGTAARAGGARGRSSCCCTART